METNDHDLLIEISANVRSILDRLKPVEDKVRCLEIDSGKIGKQTETNTDEIEKLRTTNQTHNWINSAIAVIAGILGISVR